MAPQVAQEPQGLALRRVPTRHPEQTGQGHFSACANGRNQAQVSQSLREVPLRKRHHPLQDFCSRVNLQMQNSLPEEETGSQARRTR